jgi:hypothetical protein
MIVVFSKLVDADTPTPRVAEADPVWAREITFHRQRNGHVQLIMDTNNGRALKDVSPGDTINIKTG